MRLPIYQIDAFAPRPFSGNPAAVCPLDAWLPDALMQDIAAENNLSETAYFVPEGDRFTIRWFTPTREVALCGHATLASAYLLIEHLAAGGDGRRDGVVFESMHSGTLSVHRSGERLALDFPSKPPRQCDRSEALGRALGRTPVQTWEAENYLAVFESQRDVVELEPDFGLLADCHPHGVIATAPGDDCDFVSRYFAPSYGIDEDPATGSTHCTLTPYWSRRLGRESLHAVQVSRRGGELYCENRGERVYIGGDCRLYLQGEIEVEVEID